MSQASGIRSALPAFSDPTIPAGDRKLWKRWQIVFVIGRTVFLLGFFVLMEYRRVHDLNLVLSQAVENHALIRAISLLAVGTFLEVLLFALINRWEAKQPTSSLRSVTVLAGGSLLWLFCFLPGLYALVLGPAAMAIMKTISHR
jgi:hypothetical protein